MNVKVTLIIIAICAVIWGYVTWTGSTGEQPPTEQDIKMSQMEESLEYYSNFDDCPVITEDSEGEIWSAVNDRYGESVADDVIDIIRSNTNNLGDY